MNKLTLSGATNFALTTDALAFMQSSYEALEKLGALGGDNYIVSGCEVSGSSVTSGWIFLKGKLMPFTGGTIKTNVKIIKTINTINVDIASREQTTYHAEFGTSADPDDNVAWADIKRPDTSAYLSDQIKTLLDTTIPNINGRLNTLEDETRWTVASLIEGADDLESYQLGLKKKGNVLHYRVQILFNKSNPTVLPKWSLPAWAIPDDPIYSYQHHKQLLWMEKIGAQDIIPALEIVFRDSDAFVDRGNAIGTTFGNTNTSEYYVAEGTYIV